MTSGKVIETEVHEKSNTVWINVKSDDETMGILVERTAKSRCVSEGDLVWWQADLVYWTPKYNSVKREGQVTVHYDIILKRASVGKAVRPSEVDRCTLA